jgi:ATP-dependent protease HslVU (ClpYQ) ATPase subunit
MAEFSDTISKQTEKITKKLQKKLKKGKITEEEVEKIIETTKVEPTPVEPPKPTNDEIMIGLLTEIRDNLTTKKK